MSRIDDLHTQLQPYRDVLINHAVYQQMNDLSDFHTFMEHHVYAVWDFMSLLKSLQNRFACNTVPWQPSPFSTACRMINEIVLAEESDDDGNGGFTSHFELYYRSMESCGANTRGIGQLIHHLKSGVPLEKSIAYSDIPVAAVNFMQSTFDIIKSADICAIASAFTFGRENLLPDVFQRIVNELNNKSYGKLEDFNYYLERHIGLDGDEHGPMANKLIELLCQDNHEKWMIVEIAAIKTLVARKDLWDAILLETSKSPI